MEQNLVVYGYLPESALRGMGRKPEEQPREFGDSTCYTLRRRLPSEGFGDVPARYDEKWHRVEIRLVDPTNDERIWRSLTDEERETIVSLCTVRPDNLRPLIERLALLSQKLDAIAAHLKEMPLEGT